MDVHGGHSELVALATQVAQRLRHVRQRDVRDVLAEGELLDQLQQVVGVEGLLPPALLGVAAAGGEQGLRDLLVGGELQQAVGGESIWQMTQGVAQLPQQRVGDLVVVPQASEKYGVDVVLRRVELEQRPVLVEKDALDHDDGLQRLATSIIFLTFSRFASSRKAEKSIMKPPPSPQTSASLRQ